MLDPPHLPAVGGSLSERLRAERAAERAATGFCLVGHPTAHAGRAALRAGAVTLADALAQAGGGEVVAAACVRQVAERRTKRGDYYATLWLEDARTRCEASCFPSPWSRAFPAVLDGDGGKSDPDRVLLLTATRDREPGRLVVSAAEPLDPSVLPATPAHRRIAELARLRDELGDFAVVDTETTLGPPDDPLALALGLQLPAVPGGGGPVGGAGKGTQKGDAGAEDRDGWLARQRVVELGAVFFRRVRGRAPRRGEAVGSDGLVPQWVEFKRVARFCDPGCPIDADSRRVHGIGDDRVAGQPTFAARAADLSRVLSAWPTVVTYNGSRFDAPVLLREFARCGVAPPRTLVVGHLDLADLVARRYVGARARPLSNKLGDQCAYWGVPLSGAHRADADAAATGAMLVKMLQSGGP